MKKIFLATAFIFTLVLSASAQTQSRDDVIREIEAKRAELAVLEQKILAVADSDRQEFASFLSQPHTGMIRLMPRETYDGTPRELSQFAVVAPITRSLVRLMNTGTARTLSWHRSSYP